jgi:hypothetical protein
MKILLTVLFSFLLISGNYAGDKYENAMKKNIDKIGECRTPADYINTANNFERIALAENDKWLPFYYSSFLYVLACYVDSSAAARDNYLDKAVQFISKADSLEPDNSEIYTLKGMIAQGRMQIDPMNRWQKYGPAANAAFEKAMAIDTLNPRPEYLIGIATYYTPEQFGGGAANAKPILEKSLKKYEQFQPAGELMPAWGKTQVEKLLAKINGQE